MTKQTTKLIFSAATNGSQKQIAQTAYTHTHTLPLSPTHARCLSFSQGLLLFSILTNPIHKCLVKCFLLRKWFWKHKAHSRISVQIQISSRSISATSNYTTLLI